MRKRGGIESRVMSPRERADSAWCCDQAITLWTERRRAAIHNRDEREVVRARWHIRRATRLLERLRPSAKPCKSCSQREGKTVWKPIGSFYWHSTQDRHDTNCAECRRDAANRRYRNGLLYEEKRGEELLQRGEKLIQEMNQRNREATADAQTFT